MNAQGETWTIELTLETAGLMLSHTPVHVKNIEKILSIVRLHPELVAALEKLSAYKGYSNIRDLLARAHALGETNGP